MSTQLRSGDRLRIRVGHTHRFTCCDCGLTHDVAFKAIEYENGVRFIPPTHVIVEVKGNARSTAANRRRKP